MFENLTFAENPEPRCPCVLVLDTSASMFGPPLAALSKALHMMRAELLSDSLAID